MSLSDYEEHLFKQSQRVVKQLREQDLPPTIENYSLWLTHLMGRNSGLTRSIKHLAKRPEGISKDDASALYQLFIVKQEEETVNLARGLDTTLAQMLESFDEMSVGTSSYDQVLGSAAEQFQDVLKTEDAVKLIHSIRAATVQMQEQTNQLQAETNKHKSEITVLKESLKAAQIKGQTDALTGVANRGFFDESLIEKCAESKQWQEPVSLLMIDIDHFKAFNDQHGHQIGDMVLRLVASCLKTVVKGRDIVTRYGGEEFAIILPETELGDAVTLGSNICKTLAGQHIVLKSKNRDLGVVTVSIGAAHYRTNEPENEFVARADAALYAAKENGRNRVEVAE